MEDDLVRRVRLIKAALDLTYAQIGDVIGVSDDTAINYFSGRSRFPVPKLVVFAKHYNLNLTWIITGEGASNLEAIDSVLHLDVEDPSRSESSGLEANANRAYSKTVLSSLTRGLQNIYDRLDALEKEVETLKNAK